MPAARAAFRGAVFVLAVVGLVTTTGACCDGDQCPAGDADAGPPACEGLGCAVATPGCAVEDIASEGGAVCARCARDAGDVEICGAAEVARCEAREDSEGDPCRICATDLGEILYDSCFSDVAPEVAVCERTSANPDPIGPGGPGAQDGSDVVCETCTDASGAVVSTLCEPAHDECHEVDDGGRTCRECTRDGAVVVFACEQPDIAPRSCEAYANELGRCIDCYDDADELLSHSCTLAEDVFVSCSEIVTQEGLRCQACVDRNGAQVARSCEADVSELQQCALLEYTEQSCVVCVDQFHDVAFTSCESPGCESEAACLPPPACFFETSPDGALCRTCPVGGNGEVEQRCVVETNLECAGAPSVEDPSAPSCLSCVDRVTQVEVYRRCDGSGAPPTCEITVNADGATCEVCDDPVTSEPIYATCDGQTCYALGRFAVTGPGGGGLVLDGAPAVAECSECGVAQGLVGSAGFEASCSLRTDCGGTDLTDPSAVCDKAVVFRLAPRICDNPWELAGFSVDGQEGTSYELLVVLGYALELGNVGLVTAARVPGTEPHCTDACSCERGDVIDIAVRAEDAIATTQLFEPILRRCASNDGCEAGGTCRLDGACSY